VLDRQQQTDGKYDLSYFAYDADRDSFTCLEGHKMRLRKVDPVTRIKRYNADTKICGACPIRKSCTTAPARTFTRHIDEDARQIARELSRTEKFETSRRKRKKVEMLFAHLKRNLGFTRLRLRGLRGASDEFLLAATAQNLKRLAKLAPV
jgi:Transposase DDE domain